MLLQTRQKTKIKNMGSFTKLASNKTAAGVKLQVEWMLTLELTIKDIYDVAEISDDMDRECFNQSTYNSIMRLFIFCFFILVAKPL